MLHRAVPLALACLLLGCDGPVDRYDGAHDGDGKTDDPAPGRRLGAHRAADGAVAFRLHAGRATRVELCLFAEPFGAAEVDRRPLARDAATPGVWQLTLSGAEIDALLGPGATLYYGYRAFGPNWPHVEGWAPGSAAGFVADVDADGNRYNPNKLLADPYARELSHDPRHAGNRDATVFASGPQHRAVDSARAAPKSILVAPLAGEVGPRPTRPLRDEIIYEVHVRGLTMADPSVPPALRGTYAGAALKADYLADLGVTAIELLPVQETQNEENDLEVGTGGDNYWGYATLGYFAPERRYAADRSPGGPTRELREMVRAFHQRGIKVYLDVVYNHTGEGGLWDGSGDVAELLSLRGLDNAAYYELAGGNRFYFDSNGVAGNLNVAERVTRDLVIDSLAYLHREIGVDGFRFDLAAVLGNACARDCFRFDAGDPDNVLNRAARELPARPADGGDGVELIAEPWAIGVYQLGGFPAGWAEWNGGYRDRVRADQNLLGSEPVTPGELASRIAGSADLFGDDGRAPWHSINFLVAHDGLTLRDLYACNGKHNGQPWPFGPSDGGDDHNRSWDQGGDPAAQRQAARTGLALLALSAGVPMLTGGDERLRSQRCNNNVYNLDSEGNWIDWSTGDVGFARFTRGLLRFRAAHRALRPAHFFRGSDEDGDGLRDVDWLTESGGSAGPAQLDASDRHFLAYRLDVDELGDEVASIYVAYNGGPDAVDARLPAARPGLAWHRVADTAAWMEGEGNVADPGGEARIDGPSYGLAGRSLVLLIER